MIPFDFIWGMLHEIFANGPMIRMSQKISGYDEEVYEELTGRAVDLFFSTVDYVNAIDERIQFLDIENVDFTYRFKDENSIKLKLERLNMTKQLYKVANDILGMRFIIGCTTEELMEIVQEFVSFHEDWCSIADITTGKKNDDGYKGIHIYVRPNNVVFPVEVQFWTRTHALLNQYLHDNIYKMGVEALNHYALDLRDWLESVPSFSPSDGLTVKSYVDYIYEQAFSTKDDPEDDMEVNGDNE